VPPPSENLPATPQGEVVQAGTVHGEVNVDVPSPAAERLTTLNSVMQVIELSENSATRTRRRVVGQTIFLISGAGVGLVVNYLTNVPASLWISLAGLAVGLLGGIIGSLLASAESRHKRAQLEQLRLALQKSAERRVSE
jgi:hypothetical protein